VSAAAAAFGLSRPSSAASWRWVVSRLSKTSWAGQLPAAACRCSANAMTSACWVALVRSALA
jgi:hypothetical protein